MLAIVQTDTYSSHMTNADGPTANTPDVQIANRVMNAILVKGTNVKALAEGTGISYSTLRRSLHQTLTNRRSFTIQEICSIAAALNVPPSLLLPAELAAQDAA